MKLAAISMVLGLASFPAYAGCVGVSIGDPCIGLPTPSEERRPVVIEREAPPVIIERPPERPRSHRSEERNYYEER